MRVLQSHQCTLKGFGLAFNADLSPPAISDDKKEVHAQVTINYTQEMLCLICCYAEYPVNLVAVFKNCQRPLHFKWVPQADPGKSLKTDHSQVFQRLPSSDRSSKNVSPES